MTDKLLGWSCQDPAKFDYADECQRIAENDELFAEFKRNPKYTVILEHVSSVLGAQYVDFLKYHRSGQLMAISAKLDEIKLNDRIGAPLTYAYELCGIISPSTIRYIKVLSDLLYYKIDLSNKHIVEIGGGYGGQCLILSKFFKFASYTIIDLPQVNHLQKRYLAANDLSNVQCCSINDFTAQNIDFLMSNYAFSELNKVTQHFYADKILKHAHSGYLQINPDAPEALNVNESRSLLSQLLTTGTALFFPDAPMNFYYPNNFTFLFNKSGI